MKKTKTKPITSSSPEEKEPEVVLKEIPPVEVKPPSPDAIFTSDKIDKIFNATDPIEFINILLQDIFRKVNGNANFDEERLRAEAEFHVNNLIFLKQNFSFDNDTISTLMNILGKLIKFKNMNNIMKIKSKIMPNESQGSINSVDISGNQLPEEGNNNKNPAINEEINNENPENNNKNGDDNDMAEENEKVNNNVEEEVDFLFLSKDKLKEFKDSLNEENLIPKTKSDFTLANNPDKVRTNGKFFLNIKEINSILKYIQSNYLPYIRMWYFFQNEKRNTTERKLEVIINTSNFNNMPLSLATQEKTDEEKKEEIKKQEESKKLAEEQNKEETYLDLIDRLGLNEDTKKIIIEKIEELHKDVEGKIDNRKKTLEDKIREIDETIHGKKK